jgi:hypothetical protein
MVEGAYTPPKSVFIPPARTTSRSSMLSAPAHIPAITVVSFGAGLADPDLIFGCRIQILSANNCDSPVWAANVITGTSPAHDTRWSSSNTAEAGRKLCDTCTGSAFPNSDRLLRENTNHPSSEGTFLISTPRTRDIQSVDRGLDRAINSRPKSTAWHERPGNIGLSPASASMPIVVESAWSATAATSESAAAMMAVCAR